MVPPQVGRATVAKPLKVLALGTCMTRPLIEAGQARGHQVDHYLYGFRKHQNLDRLRNLHLTSYDFGIVVPTLRSVLAVGSAEDNQLAFWRGEPDATTLLENCDDSLAVVLDLIADHVADTVTMVQGFLEPSTSYLGPLHRYDVDLDFKEFVHELNKRLSARTREHENMWFVDPNPIVDGIGRDGFQDDVLTSSTHAAFVANYDFRLDAHRPVKPIRATELFGSGNRRQRYGRAMWDEIERLVTVIKSGQRIKLIIVDLDDTLWRGTAAEDDFSLLERREGWPLGFVEALLIYKRRGGLLAICSKNSESPALVWLEEIWGNVLRLDDFAAVHISWDSKSEGVARILTDVNVLPANTLFIDDNPRERAEVKATFPTMNMCSENHYLWRRDILYSTSTQVARITEEAAVRTSLVQGRAKREESRSEATREEWLGSLDLSLTVERIAAATELAFPRALELLNKTNQFNTTGKRRSAQELGQLFDQGGYLVVTSLRDRFMDNGLVGVAVVAGNTIEQAVLSCRVFGLDAEIGMLQVACDLILQDHGEAIGKVVETDSNFVCQDIYQRLGFTQHDAGYVTRSSPACPPWIQPIRS